MNYKLLAADMDGTALNDKKELTPKTAEAMRRACRMGKQAIFSTGRSISLIRPYLAAVPEMRYLISGSGASVIDLKTGGKLSYTTIDAETAKYIFSCASGYYMMPIIFKDDKTYSSEWCVRRIDEFGLRAYGSAYDDGLCVVDDAFSHFMEHPGAVEKINFFFTDENDTTELLSKIENLPVSLTSVTAHSVEINATGVSKAKGLKIICDKMGIAPAECIAVGDSQNDEEMLSLAGLGVCMANGTPRLMEIADVIAPDCNSDGLAEIIEQYLLA